MTADEILTLLCVNAYLVYRETLIGPSVPNIERLQDELRNPRVGDLVMETSTIYDRKRDLERIGVLLVDEWRPMYTPEQAMECGFVDGEKIPNERVFVIQPLGGGEYTWTNASFIKVKRDL